MRQAVIVDALRTPIGKRNGKLSDWHPVDLTVHVLTALSQRNQLDPALIDDVIVGCVTQVGEQALNVARSSVLAAGWPESVPATTVDRQCGSSQQAIHFAAQGVMAGAYDVVIAAGVESMSRVPMGSSVPENLGHPFSATLMQRYGDSGLPAQGICADMIADQWGLSREGLDLYAARSQQRAAAATTEGRFDNEIVPMPVVVDGHQQLMSSDEGIRPDTTAERLGTLKPVFRPDGKTTAGNASQISDGAAALLIMHEDTASRLGMKVMARLHAFAVAGASPVTMLTGPVPATRKVLASAGLTLGDIDLFEVNEAFASVVLVWERELQPDMDRVNVNGGAIALGHPLGCSGARLMTTLVHQLQRIDGRYGLQTMCEGGGMANATIIERV